MRRHSAILVLVCSATLLLFFTATHLHIASSSNLYFLRSEDLQFINCAKEPDAQLCNDLYPHFEAYKLNEASRDGCWSEFDYVRGVARFPPQEQKMTQNLLNRSCVDHKLRSFVNLRDTRQVLTKRCSSCSLVFNSGRLLDAGL